MAGYFSRFFDPPRRPSFFGPEADPEDATSTDDATDAPQPRRPFFSADPALFQWALNSPSQSFGSLAPAGGRMVAPVVANFGPQGGAGKQEKRPYWADIPLYPSTDPRMPFYVLPPNAVFNMPIIRRSDQLPGTPYVGDKDGRPHLDGWNPWENRIVSPGRGI